MLEYRTHKLTIGAMLALAIFISAGLGSAVASDDINNSVVGGGAASPGLNATSEVEVEVVATDSAGAIAQTDNETEMNDTATPIVTETVVLTPAETANETKTGASNESVAVTAPEPVEEGAGAATRDVCLNGCNYTTIQAAVDAAVDGDVVEVGSGTYNENVVVTKSITLRGVNTGEGVPMVNAQGNGSAVVLKADGIVLEGLYVTNAAGNYTAGIEVVSDDNLIARTGIWNCKNWGVYLKGGSTNNTISGCIISNNGNDGIMVFKSPGNFFIDNVLSNSGDDGIQILQSDNNRVEANVVVNNADVGIFIDTSQNTVVTGNTLSYNSNGIGLSNSGIDRVGFNRFFNNAEDLKLA